MIKNENAAICNVNWSVDGSQSEGSKMTKKFLKLLLRAFNGECDAAIAKVKYNNMSVVEKRIENSYKAINKLGEPNKSYLNQAYLDAKLRELYLVHEYNEIKQEEKEEQYRVKEQIREEQKILKEIEQAEKDAIKEEALYEKAIMKARQQLALATEVQKADFEREIESLQLKLREAEEKHQRAISRAQMTKSGHVYVISNIGSFGEKVYKIGMTRRLEPLDRVRELGGASVPFRFDVHAMIYSEDAPGLENKLHKMFDHKRMNRVNLRREFFKISIDEIESAVRNNFNSDVEFTRFAEAEEFRKSESVLKELVKPQ